MSLIALRYASATDAATIADMSRQTFYEAFAFQNSPENMSKFMNEQFTKEALIREVGTPGNIFFLAYDGEKPVGYLRMRESINPTEFSNSNAIEIARIYVLANSIGKGVGKMLMQKCVEVAVAKNKKYIWLGVWEYNHRAIDFYFKWGFEKFGTQPFLLGDDLQTDWLMKKEVTARQFH